MKEDRPRLEEHAKDPGYERLLANLNDDLASLPPYRGASHPRRPVVFIVGPPRSGTTLLYQALAATGAFTYPTNAIARFPSRPAFGWRVQELLRPCLPDPSWDFQSRAGRTLGWFQPHEFGYFWERYLPFDDHHQPGAGQLASVDSATFALGLAEFEAVASGPLLFKNAILSYVIDYLAEALPTTRFVEIERDDAAIIASIRRMRVEYYGDERAWFSVRPRDVERLRGLGPEEQARAQVQSLRKAISESRARIGPRRWTRVRYADLCREPRQVVRELARDVGVGNVDVSELPDKFPARPG